MPALATVSHPIALIRSRTGAIRTAGVGIAAIVLGVVVLSLYLRSARYTYPVGDGAMLEVYTLHAARGAWPFGPYSQFGWQHPGPLFFYLLAPFYAMAGYRSIAMNVGAFAINLASVATIVVVFLRCATPTVALAGTTVLGVYLFRLQQIVGSYWNPHVVVLPVAALLLLSSRLATGRVSTLPAIALAASLIAQTHVSLVPYAALIAGAALVTAIAGSFGDGESRLPHDRRPFAWWINLTAWLLLLLWLLPIAEELIHRPGNITRMLQFFRGPYSRPPWDLVFSVWGDVMSAVYRPGLHLPVGWGLTPAPGILLPAFAIAQVLLLMVCCRVAAVRQDRFCAALSGLGALASLIAFWSISRIRVRVDDHMVFWMSIIGALNWAIVVGVLSAPYVVAERARVIVRRVALTVGILAIGGSLYAGIDQLEGARHSRTLSESERNIKAAAGDIDAYLVQRGHKRPLFRIAGGAWGDGAGIVLDRYRRGVPVAVDAELVGFFGEPLAPTRREDVTLAIVDAPVHDDLRKRSGNVLVSHHGPVYIYTGTELDW